MIENYIHPDDYPELAVHDVPKTERDWEIILLVGLSLFGLGVLLALGVLELPINPFK